MTYTMTSPEKRRRVVDRDQLSARLKAIISDLREISAELKELQATLHLPATIQPSLNQATRNAGWSADHTEAALVVLATINNTNQ
jgi:3-hydroxyisobutyrate dehydrogenase-like beta-hydroxyacid dehydrogenase